MPAPSAPRAASTRPCPAARECRVPPVVRAGVGRCGRGCRRSGYAGSGARRRCARVRCSSAPQSSAPCVARRRSGAGSGAARGRWSTSVCGWPRPSASPGHSSARLWSHQGGRASSPSSIAGEGRKSAMSNQRLMKVKEKAGDGYAKTNAIGGGGRNSTAGTAGVLNALSTAPRASNTQRGGGKGAPVHVDRCANDPIALAGSALPRGARARVPVLGTRIVPL